MTPLAYALEVLRSTGRRDCLSILLDAGARVTWRAQQEIDSFYTPGLISRLIGSEAQGRGILHLLLRACLDPLPVIEQMVDRQHLNALPIVLQDPHFKRELRAAIPSMLHSSGKNLVHFGATERGQCNFLVRHIISLILRAISKGFLQGADRLLEHVSVGNPDHQIHAVCASPSGHASLCRFPL